MIHIPRLSKSDAATRSKHRARKSILDRVQFVSTWKDFLHETELKNVFCDSAFHQVNAMTLIHLRESLSYSKICRVMNLTQTVAVSSAVNMGYRAVDTH
jgi:hypothetical protein